MKKVIAGLIGSVLLFSSVFIVGKTVSAQSINAPSGTSTPQGNTSVPYYGYPYGYGYQYGYGYPYYANPFGYGYPVYDPLMNRGLFSGTTNLGDLLILDMLFGNNRFYYGL